MMKREEPKIDKPDEQRIAELLGKLQRVEAPGDFLSRVNARIAAAAPKNRRRWYLPYAVPAGLLVLLGLFLGYSSLFLSNIDFTAVAVSDTPNTSERFAAPILQDANPVVSQVADNESRPAVVGTPVASRPSVATVQPRVRTTDRPSSTSETSPQGSSIDLAVEPARDAILPPGFATPSPTPEAERPEGFEGNVKLPAVQVLRLLGIESEWSGEGWRVISVSPNSPGGRLDVRRGDQLISIDERKLEQDTVFEGGLAGRTFTVIRGGHQLILGSQK
jgi:hypothetical protein